MSIRAVMVDIGGVLEFTPDTGWKTRWEKKLNKSIEQIDQQLKEMGRDGSRGTCSEEEWWDGLRAITGMSQEQVDEFMRDFWREYLGELNVELVNFIRRLRPHYRTAIISNSFLGARQKEVDLYHFDELVDVIIYSHEVGLLKPDRRIYALTCERLGVQPSGAIFVDDFEPNITGAREFGLHAILFQETRQAISEIQTLLTQ